MNQTKLSSTLKRSAKLPKLNIQQQIDNHEVAQRMNRKICFTKNPRHLAQTITYAEAFTKPQSNQSKFRVQPQQLLFSHYDNQHIYESEVKLINQSGYIQRIKVTPLKQKQFVIASIKYPSQTSGDIAPGMAVTVSVRFRPPSLHDYQDELILIAADGVIKVPIFAQRQRCQISWPKTIQCGHCWVGDLIKKEVILHNKGGDAKFILLGCEESAQSYRIGCFKISPTKLQFDQNTQLKLNLQFIPEEKGVFKQTIKFKTYEGDQEQVEICLEGGAYNAQIVLQELNGQPMLEQKVNSTLYIENSEVGKESVASVKIRNLAVVQVDYFWHYQAGNVTVAKKEGKMKPSELVQFKITIKPQQTTPQSIKLDLYLFNLPEKSLMGNVVAKKINGKEAIPCLAVEVVTKPMRSQLVVFPLHQRIVQPLYQNQAVKECIKITNNSTVRRFFNISKICEDEGVQTVCAQPQGVIEPNCQKAIDISFSLINLTRTDKKAHYLVSFDSGKSQIFSLEGRSTYPQIQYSQQFLYYGLLKTHTLNKKKIVLKNTQTTLAEITVHNPHRFYILDFYDFYQFENQQSYKPKFNIYNSSTGLEVTKPVRIPPQSQITLDCYLNVMGQESVDIEVEFELKDGDMTKIKIAAQVQDVEMSMNREVINMREIYKGNVYNSNKFLSRQLQLVNDGNHDCGFSIVPPNFDQCDISIQPLRGIVKKNQTQRIDLIMEPIKTGDFDFKIQWTYFDDFKANPDLYPELIDQIGFNQQDGKKSLIKQKNLQIVGKIKGMDMNYYIKDDARAKKVKVKLDDGLQSVKFSNSSYQHKSSQKTHENQKLVYPLLEELNFYNCQINLVRQVEIIIQNDSGLTTEYQIKAQQFHSVQGSLPSGREVIKGLMKIEEEPFSSEMGKTFIRNRALDRSQKVHLGNNKGISILCEPSSGVLHKKQSQKVMITMFNDTSGRFKDNLLIQIKNHQTKKIPVDIHIKGTPVALSRNQLGIDFNQQIPFMHLGTILHSNGLVKKSIKVVNNGPKEVELTWLVYPYNKVNKEKDIFKIEFQGAVPGSNNLVELKWNAVKPDLDKDANFSIQPRQKKLKGREEFTFTIFIQQIKDVGQFANLLICEPTLIDGNNRTQMQEFAVVVKTQTIQPALTMDVEHKSKVNMLERFANSHQEAQTDSNNFQRLLKFKNTLNANLTFDLSVINKEEQFDCFKLIQTKTNSPAAVFSSTSKAVQTSFVVTSGSILEVKVQLTANPTQLQQWPMEQKIRREGQVVLDYSNGEKQVIDLIGWLYRPWALLQMPNHQQHSSQNFQIDFGTVHIKNFKKQSLYLMNPSKVDGRWSISYLKYHQSIKYKFEQALWTNVDYEDQTIQDDKKCWRLNMDGGIVKNKTIPVHYMPNTLALPGQDDSYASSRRPTQLQIMFKPDAKGLYKSKFRLSVSQGPSFDIIVKGKGTYDEQMQKK